MTIETANRLFELRKKHNLSQEELAEKLGVSRQAVSKWERSEASPDTDNLIALAKIYDLSLDELIFGEKEQQVENGEAETEPETEASDDESPITISHKNGTVKIDPTCIVVEDDDGETVKIGLNGIEIHTSKKNGDDDEDEDDDDDDDDFDISIDPHVIIKDKKPIIKVEKVSKKIKNKMKFWLEIPYPIICAVIYLILGFTDSLGGWAHSWIIFVTVPLYYSLIEAIYKRRFAEFAYPVLTAFVYLYLGLYHGNWHPSWIVFATIPIYYPIAEAIDKKIRSRRQAKEENKVE